MQPLNAIPLFCKPTFNPVHQPVLYGVFNPAVNGTIHFRSLHLTKDLPTIYQWVNMEYSSEFWQMNGHFSQLYAIYQCMELNPYCHSFIGLYNKEVICQFDVYSVFADELRNHVDHETHDCGFHLLMSPNKQTVHGLTKAIIDAFLAYYFSFPDARRMYAEPDINNSKSVVLLERCGFSRLKTVEMSYKQAHVYCLNKK